MCQTYHGKQNAIAIPFEEDYLPLLQKVTNKTSMSSKNIAASEGDCNPKSADIFLRALDSTIHTMIQNGDDKSSVSGSLLILDHITSNTAIHVPISSIAKYAKEEYGMVVAVDGAHALLSLPLDMGSLLSTSCEGGESGGYVDIYLTNAHKWFSSPRGAAMLFCANPEIRETILAQPAVVSHGVDDGFLSRFMWDGCRDYSAQLSLPAILNYWNNAGVDTARDEMKRNLKEGVKRLIAHWHPDVVDSSSIEDHLAEAGLTLVPLDMHAPMLALVRLPNHISGGGRYVPSSIQWECKTSTDAKRVQDFLFSQNVEVPIKCVRGVLYARVSCHVYNTIEEFEHLAKVALKYGVS